MECIQVRSQLEEYEEGHLSTEERAPMDDHLQMCPSCGRQRELLRESWEILGQLPTDEPDFFASRRFLAKLQGPSVRQTVAYALAAASLLMLIGLQGLFRIFPLGGNPALSPGATAFTAASPMNPDSATEETILADLSFGDINTPFTEVISNYNEEVTR